MELFQAVIGIAVSVIPEGLPAIITITLAIGVQRMAQRNAIIRRLPAVETLGSVSRICSDKTGTLTLMEMMVVSAVTAEAAYQVTGDGYAPEGEVKQDGAAGGQGPGARAAGPRLLLCNDAELFQRGRRLEGRGRSDRGRALSVRDQARHGPAGRADRVSADRRHPVRIRAPLHGDAAPGRRTARRSCWSRARRRSSSSTAIGSRRGTASRRRSIAIISSRRRTSSRRRASACWRWRGSRTRASRPAASARRICRRTSSCSA